MPSASRVLDDIVPGEHVVLIGAPAQSYAGRLGERAVVTDVSHGAVHVQFGSQLRECYPDSLFRKLFDRLPVNPRA